MTATDDDDAEMTDQLEYPSGDIALLIRELRELGGAEMPDPSPELEALLSHGCPAVGQRRTKRRIAVVTALVIGSTSVTGFAAAADQLPGPVANVINDLTPFHIDDHHPRPATPTPNSPPTTATPNGPPNGKAPTPASHPPPKISSDGPELDGAPPVGQPETPPPTGPSASTREDDRPTESLSRSPAPSSQQPYDGKSSTRGSQTSSPTPAAPDE